MAKSVAFPSPDSGIHGKILKPISLIRQKFPRLRCYEARREREERLWTSANLASRRRSRSQELPRTNGLAGLYAMLSRADSSKSRIFISSARSRNPPSVCTRRPAVPSNEKILWMPHRCFNPVKLESLARTFYPLFLSLVSGSFFATSFRLNGETSLPVSLLTHTQTCMQ